MLHEFFVRMLGLGMAGLLQFEPVTLTYRGDSLRVEAPLRGLVTGEIREAVRGGYPFAVDYSVAIVINDRKSYRSAWTNRLEYHAAWRVNGVAVESDSVAAGMGAGAAVFPRLRFHPGDELLVLITAVIAADATFTRSTGLPTSILWNFHLPKSGSRWSYGPGGFLPR
jgi:hypothetical protein